MIFVKIRTGYGSPEVVFSMRNPLMIPPPPLPNMSSFFLGTAPKFHNLYAEVKYSLMCIKVFQTYRILLDIFSGYSYST